MPTLLEIYNRIESVKGRRLVFLLLVVFAIFVPLGLLLGNSIKPKLNKDENAKQNIVPNKNPATRVSYQGRVKFIEPFQNGDDIVSYVLVDVDNKEIVFLFSKDQKLKVAEGLNVQVSGELKDMVGLSKGKKVLEVSEVLINNAPD